MAGGRHPVGGELHVREFLDARRGQVGERLADRHAPAGSGVDERERRALAHGHRLAGVTLVAAGGDRHVGHRHLPRADHLIAAHQPGHGTIADGDEKRFIGDGRKPQHAIGCFLEIEALGLEAFELALEMADVALHLRRLAEQDAEIHIDRLRHARGKRGVRRQVPVRTEVTVFQQQMPFCGGLADHGIGTTLALA